MKSPSVQIVLRLPAPLNRAVRRAAKREDRSINKFAQAALRSWVQATSRRTR
jgi:predicted HicB family RNase H-like nuclease